MSQDRAKAKPIAPRPNLERRRAAFLRKRLSPPDRHRARDLFSDLLTRLGPGPHDAVTEAEALEIAELTVSCEDLRDDLAKVDLKGKANLVNAITRLQSTTNRAKRNLLKRASAKPIPRLMQHLYRKPNA